MNTLQLNNATWWGRVLLLLRADLYEQRRNMIILSGLIFLVIFILPRIPLLVGMSYSEWAETYIDEVMYIMGYSVSTLFGVIYTLYYYNRKVQHSKPMAFAHYPARVWEKILAAVGFSLLVWLVCWGLVLLSQIIAWLTIPGDIEIYWRPWLYGTPNVQLDGLNWDRIPLLLQIIPIVLTLISLIYVLVSTLGVIAFRNFLKGFFLSQLAFVLLLWLMVGLGLFAAVDWFNVARLVERGLLPYSSLDYKMTISTLVVLLGLVRLLFWLIYRKLKTVEK
ncbi:MAG: hypothetical protein Q4A64_08885 [Porphyromonadaceae bacterium]|nr:hypothetical protein [Porphyromonadaceae bacterium]